MPLSYAKIKQYMRKGRSECNSGSGNHPLYVNVEMDNGNVATNWIGQCFGYKVFEDIRATLGHISDSLQASFPGVQVLYGDIEEAVCHHVLYYSIWKR